MKMVLLIFAIWGALSGLAFASDEVFECEILAAYGPAADGSLRRYRSGEYAIELPAEFNLVRNSGEIVGPWVTTILAEGIVVTDLGLGDNSYSSVASFGNGRTQMIKIDTWREGLSKPFVVFGMDVYSGLCRGSS